jgi:hypothetical protein
MLWITRSRIRVNRAATGWLVRRFIDPAASFRFVDSGEVARVQQDEAGIGFDAPGARYPHKDSAGRCAVEALAQECQPSDHETLERSGFLYDSLYASLCERPLR